MDQDFAPTRTVVDRLKAYFLRGVLFVVPALVTLAVVAFVVGFVSGFLQPVASFVTGLVGVGGFVADLVVVVLLAAAVVLAGAAIETLPHGVEAADFFHSAVESVPGVGRVYAGFREMSTTIAQGEESFRDVKLVEYPREGSYTMAFVTADAPPSLEESVGHTEEGMMSLFMPMGPNPVMGGFVIYVARDRVYDIDLSVEEGLQAIITSGVTVADPESGEAEGRLGLLEDGGE